MRLRALAAAAALALVGPSCAKVPIFDVGAGFSLADAAWFAGEETLFVFYEVQAEQGIGEPSIIEITYVTDEEVVDWTELSTFEAVHTHLPVDCGVNALCGSASIHIPDEPRDVELRLRYHRDGELSLDAGTVFNIIDEGEPYSHRSFIVYGVFDAANQRVQWRGRHQFPTLRNEQAEEYGLRRSFSVEDQRHGTTPLTSTVNPYGYGIDCPKNFTATDLETVQTDERAIFSTADLPIDASASAMVCATSTVTDATGTFTTSALAQKNPEVSPAYDVLRSPVKDATPVRFFLEPCDRVISAEHEEMQRQRLLMGSQSTCIDDWEADNFVETLTAELTDAIEAERVNGNDMVLVIGLHQDEYGVSEAVEAALEQIVPEERHRSSPRLAGAFVFDSVARGIEISSLSSSTLWCPAELPTTLDTGTINASVLTCAILADNPELELGPLSFSSLPILTSRDHYLRFIDEYSKSQAGSVQSLSFRTPEFSTTSAHADVGPFGVVSFLDEEIFSADARDAFSYCVQDEMQYFVFRTPLMQTDIFLDLIEDKCEFLGLPDQVCDSLELGVLPIEMLSEWHSLFGEGTYELGILWDFPFLLRMEYEAVSAGSASLFGLSVPFGFSDSSETYYGTQMWTEEAFSLEEILTQCHRFCDHPTFYSAGVYHVTDLFRTTYASSCYQPDYPVLGDSGFPRDP